MVAKINVSTSLKRPLNYNENKIKTGDAELLTAVNFLQEKEELTFYDKLTRMENLDALNHHAKTKTLHVSLNFSPSDTPEQAEMIRMADEYMDKLGFGDQPYLVYRHFDSGHPHLHIVSSLIRPDGKRIKTHKLQSTISYGICRELEKKYGLIRADQIKQRERNGIIPLNATKVHYGKTQTKRSITSVLDTVLTQYKYTSLQELNAILKLYNVKADRGEPGSKMYQSGGLYYRILDERGQHRGRPVKSSTIYSSPTLKFLQKKFHENLHAKQPFKRRIKTAIDWQFATEGSVSLPEFINNLQSERIHAVTWKNENGLIYGISYVDTQNKIVFNGSELGKEYSANGIMERCKQSFPVLPQRPVQRMEPIAVHHQSSGELSGTENTNTPLVSPRPKTLLHTTPAKHTYPPEYLPTQLQNIQNKKKRRKRLRH